MKAERRERFLGLCELLGPKLVIEIRAHAFDKRHAGRVNPRGRVGEGNGAEGVGADAGFPAKQRDGRTARPAIIGRAGLRLRSRAAEAVHLPWRRDLRQHRIGNQNRERDRRKSFHVGGVYHHRVSG